MTDDVQGKGAPEANRASAVSYAETRAARVSSLVALGMAVLYAGNAFWYTYSFVPRFKLMFAEFGMPLSLMSAIVATPFWIYALPVLCAVAIVKEFLIKNRLTTLICNGVFFGIVLVYMSITIDSVYLPLLKIMTEMNNP